MTTAISSPRHLQFEHDNLLHYGADQDWFNSYWQRKAGCGPTTGAHLALYFERTGRLSLGMPQANKEDFVRLMEHSWGFLTPTLMGLNSTRLMEDGLRDFLKSLHSSLSVFSLDVPGDRDKRPGLEQAEAFIRAGLFKDSPVAFLNLHNADLPGLETWHWVTVVGMSGTGEEAMLHIYDNGNQIHVPLAAWLSKTRRGGGFVYVA